MMRESVSIKSVSSCVCGKASKCFRSFRGRRNHRIRDRKGLPPAGRKDCRHSPVTTVCEKTARIVAQQLSGSASQCGEQSGNQSPRAYDAIVKTHRLIAISLLQPLEGSIAPGSHRVRVTSTSVTVDNGVESGTQKQKLAAFFLGSAGKRPGRKITQARRFAQSFS